MITWPFPLRMSLIRSQWRSHWVCNCFPLGENVDCHWVASHCRVCWRMLAVHWVERANSAMGLWWNCSKPQNHRISFRVRVMPHVSFFFLFIWWEKNCRARVHMLIIISWFTGVTQNFKHYYQSYQCLQHLCLCGSEAVRGLGAAVCDYMDGLFLFLCAASSCG